MLKHDASLWFKVRSKCKDCNAEITRYVLPGTVRRKRKVYYRCHKCTADYFHVERNFKRPMGIFFPGKVPRKERLI